MEIIEFFNKLIDVEVDLYGDLVYHPKSDVIEWYYDGLSNPNIYNDSQLYEIYDMDFEIIKDCLVKYNMSNYTITDPIYNDNTITFDINFEI